MKRRSAAGSVVALVVVAALPALAPPPASAAPTCTIVGTPGDDVLQGTKGADVICGLGGDDRIGGSDGRDVLRGGEGDDLLDGDQGNDTMHGGPGDDTLADDGGRSVMRGGPGDDTLRSAWFNDALYGGSGDDDLDGGYGSNRLFAGTGADICTITEDDTAVGCTPDETAPVADSFTIGAPTFDVTDASPRRTLRVHVTDDTGVLPYLTVDLVRDDGAEQYGYGYVELVEGTDRDGWYEGYYQAHAYGDPGTGHLTLRLQDRSSNATAYAGPAVEVTNANPDVAAPEAELILPAKDAELTVPRKGTTFTLRAQVADDASGTTDVVVGLYHREDGAWKFYDYQHLRRPNGGDSGDGVWVGTMYLNEDAPTGVWNLTIETEDLRDRRATYAGPGYYASESPRAGLFPLPDDAGRFTVVRPSGRAAKPAVCTVKGTPRADKIVGTKGDDVICGLGGNDTIQASYGRDVVYGGPGNDVIRGSRQDDQLFGGDGDDTVYGDEGRDTIEGGNGADVILGGDLADQITGGAGNDDLYGNQGADVIRGNGGSNFCDRLPDDDTAGCVADAADPVVGAATFPTEPVDVTERAAPIGVQVKATDDTGVDTVVARLRVGGTVVGTGLLLKAGSDPRRRTGTWSGTVDVNEGVEPGAGTLEIAVTDRSGKVTTTTYPGRQVTVVNDNGDQHPPAAVLVAPGGSDSYDVGTTSQDVLVQAELTDDVTGVDRAFAYLCPPAGPCVGPVSMTDAGSDVWEATLTVPQAAPTGTWSVRLDAYDERNGLAFYGGPGLYAKRMNEVCWKAFPMGAGDFTVTD